ncbi:MAG: hypothetical protein NVSMB29_05450 [Candidatus Dormibacteria bacterium]
MANKRRKRGRQGARSARAAAVAARPRRVDVVVPDAPGRTEPEPWPHSAIFVLAGIALLLQPVAGLLRLVTVHASPSVALLRPDVILIVVAFPVAAPFAQRLTHAARPLRFLESVSMGAIVAIIYDVFGLAAVGLLPDSARRLPDQPALLAAGALAEVLAFAAAAAVYPRMQRYLLMPRRRPPRPPR